ncbi:MAG: branched-chain amino acid ABC transporter permease [Chloroflexi bacterium]|nr:branched-chain amino acid ABC transporter permease [Chloroflexota bacterium]
MAKLRPALTIGIVSGLVAFLFGGWSVTVMGLMAGAVVGLSTGTQSTKRTPGEIGREAIVPGLIAGALTAVGGALFTYVVRPAIGKKPLYSITLNFFLTGKSLKVDSITTLGIASAAGIVLALLAAWFVASRMGVPEGKRRLQLVGALAVFLLIFPIFEQSTSLNWIAAVISIQIFILLALGLNIVVGYAGLLDLGYAAFFAIGAYTTALLNSPQIGIHWNFWLVIWVAAAVAAFAGFVLGAPTLPLRGDYLAIVTLGFGEIVPVVFRNLITVTLREPFSRVCFIGCDPKVEVRNACIYACTGPLDLTAGERGINPIGAPTIPFADPKLFGSQSYLPWYFLVLALIIFSIFLIRRLRDSRLGRAWMAIREDELAASQMGIDPVKTKLLAFSMGATFSGFAGAFYGAYISAIFPGVFDFSVSIIVLCMVILGGLGNMVGVIIGGILIIGTDKLFLPQIATLLKGFMTATVLKSVHNPALSDFLSHSVDPIQMRLALFGLVLVIMMVVRPEGLIPSAERKAELHADDETPAAGGPVAAEANATGD